MSESRENKHIFTEWLEKLQQESWQLELLISGFALFGIWESGNLLNDFNDYLSVNKPLHSYAVNIAKLFLLMLKASWVVFFLNLLIHVILRGLWIGAIGLRYVSGDIEYDVLNFAPKFNEYFRRKVGGFDAYIERLEKVCSVIFAYTFLLFFIFLSFTLAIVFSMLLFQLLEFIFGSKNNEYTIFILILFWFFGFMVFIDFITLGAFKRVKNNTFSTVYSYIYRFYSFITFSFIYRPLLYNFIDYKYTRRLFWFSIPYVIMVTIIAPSFFLEANPYFPTFDAKNKEYDSSSRQMIVWNHYDDLREKNFAISGKARKRISFISLNKQEINSSYGSIFLRQLQSDGELFSKNYSIEPYREAGLRSRIFDRNKSDSLIVHLENKMSEAMLPVFKERNAKRKKERKKERENSLQDGFMEGYNSGRYGKYANINGYLSYKIDSIRNYWEQQIELAKETKILSIKDALLDLNRISIDGTAYNHLLNCKFYTHPNLKEKGILCYFPTDSLSQGEHILTLHRSVYAESLKDSIQEYTVHLPFWILR